MATIHFHQTTTATPEQFIAGLTDFGPGRSELFKNSADDYLQVHGLGPQWADVTEGSGGVWERLNYDWSNPHHVVLTTTDSNLFGGASGHTYTLTPSPTERLRSTSCSFEKERTSRDGLSPACSAPSENAHWPRHSATASKPSKSAYTTRKNFYATPKSQPQEPVRIFFTGIKLIAGRVRRPDLRIERN
jgi:hypothetical protein